MSTQLAAFSAELSTLAASAAASTVTIGRNGRGSGIVIGTDEVLTSAHNLRDRTTAVTLPDGTEVQGEVLATDHHGDLALLKVPTGDAAPVTLARPDGIGNVVVAAGGGNGNPRVAVGIVGSVNRRFRGPGGHAVSGAFEHDAALPKGASGGPVIDAAGRIVGINTHRTGTGYLARPFDEVLLGRIESLRAGVSVLPPVLGVVLAPPHVAAKLRAAVGLDPADGALVRGVDPGGAADRCGVREGDLIIGVRVGDDSIAVDGPDSLQAALDRVGATEELTLEVLRGAETQQFTASFTTSTDTAAQEDQSVADSPAPRTSLTRRDRRGGY